MRIFNNYMHLSRYSAGTDVGLQRNNNEDCYLSHPDLGLWLVADGMGGHAAGEVASAIVAQTIKDCIAEGYPLKESIQKSHEAVLSAAEAGIGGQGMGSTVVALYSSNSEDYEIAWVGDSRAYLWSPRSETPLTQLTTDHSYVQMLYESGIITEEELETHPEKNIITQCLGSFDLEEVNVDVVTHKWEKDTWIILCSDGLSDAVNDSKLQELLEGHKDIQTASQRLIDAALAGGGKDNITVQIIASPNQLMRFFQATKTRLGWFKNGQK